MTTDNKKSDSNGPIIKKKMGYQQQKEHDLEPVKGRFVFHEAPGGTLTFSFHKYKGLTKFYTLKDGQIYTLPRMVAKHLAKSGTYPIHEYQTDENGVPVVRVGRKKQRYSFESLAFFDDYEEESESKKSDLKI